MGLGGASVGIKLVGASANIDIRNKDEENFLTLNLFELILYQSGLKKILGRNDLRTWIWTFYFLEKVNAAVKKYYTRIMKRKIINWK